MAKLPRKDQRTRSILDPIHGLIRLSEREMKVVAHPLFQRLRSIRQNGLLYLVFPGATHTRFEHSIGALYVAHGMLNSLSLNSMVGYSKGSVLSRSDAPRGQAVTFPATESEEWLFLYRVTRLAALAHDLGHGPLSHTFDGFAPTRSLIRGILEDPKLEALRPLRNFILKWKTHSDDGADPRDRRVPHEVMSCVFFASIWNSLGEDPEVALAVSAAILGEHGGESAALHLTSPVARQWIPLIHDIVASAPADADRMDYMERDSRAIGVSYGLFDRNRILKSLLCYQDTDTPEPRYRLGVKQSGLKAIENLMQARYELFAQIYYHKTNRAVSRMLDEVKDIADSEMALFSDDSDLDGVQSVYLDLSDDQFFRVLLGKDTAAPAGIVQLARDIQERRLWKRILDPTTADEANGVLAILKDEFPNHAARLHRDDSKPKALKDLDTGAALLIRNGAGPYEAGRAGPWSKESPIIGALEDADRMFARVYFDSTDREVAKKMRERALELVFESREGSARAKS